MPKIQLTIILGAVAYFSTVDAGLSALYGGMISLINTRLVDRHTQKQRADLTISAQAGVGMMAISVIMRLVIVVGLILIGRFVLELKENALIISLILGICGFLMDKVLQK
ncbi:FIG048548: ATP synthase protein I2 [uncultured Candidatus Thioglobus sp.]|nr:FIG048548: ATP synthase protein I2 [uncultured Candidatus Thioglobus sp.]